MALYMRDAEILLESAHLGDEGKEKGFKLLSYSGNLF